MQLCRFQLRDEDGVIRSGIFHESRLYETDGQQPIGVHDLSKIIMLAPIQSAASFRVFDGELNYQYRNSATYGGPLTEFDAPGGELGIEARVVAVIKDAGDRITVDEAEEFILGFTLMLGFVLEDKNEHDLPFALGPFLNIPETPLPQIFAKPFQLKVNSEVVAEASTAMPDFGGMIARATRYNRVLPSDLIGAPAVSFGSLSKSLLGRNLQPGDSIQLVQEELGVLTVKVV